MDFDREYKKLNQAQKEAVDTLNGPVMVIAGPGTGKTQVLTLRIANILNKTDAQPNNILALTFTESGVKAMKQRLTKMVGESAYQIAINTFHSFANQVILENPDIFLINNQFSVLSDLERLDTIHTILDNNNFEYLKPANAPYFYANYISRAISNLKREGVTLNEYNKLINQNEKLIKAIENKDKRNAKDLKEIKDLEKQLELKKIYKLYEKEIAKLQRYDFEDLINFVVEKFETNEELLKSYQEKFQYILVDEFQDTNNAQYKILKLLTNHWGEKADIFAVGDDEQSIYRFQGASLENITRFLEDFPSTTLVNLVQNYRSTQNILDTSREVINHNTQSIQNHIKDLSKNLKSNTNQNSPLNVLHYSNGALETFSIAKKIERLVKAGEKQKEIAVIFRNNSDADEMAKALSGLNISYNLQGGSNILDNLYVKAFVKLLTVITKVQEHEEDIDLFTLLNYEYLGLDYVDNLKIARFATQKRINFFEAITSKEFSDKKVVEKPDKYLDLILTKIPKWNHVDAENIFTKTFEVILNESGFLDYILKLENSTDAINKINSLFSQVQTQVNSNKNLKLKDFLRNIDILNQNYIKIPEQDLDIKSNAITLTTAHKSKGLEFKHVFIYKCVDKKWGNTRDVNYIPLPKGIIKTESADKNEEERRLFYVALTRSKQFAYISYSEEYANTWGIKQTDPSIFTIEVAEELCDKKEPEDLESKKMVSLASKMLLQKEATNEVSANEKLLLQELIEKYKMSVTGLNTYLQCPYKFKLNTILRTPRAKAPYLALGTAVHKALEEYYKSIIATNKTPKDDFLIQEFEKALNKEVLTKKEKKTQLRKGKAILNSYLKNYKDQIKKPEYLERLFGYGFSKIYVKDVPLVGKVDRVDLIKQEQGEKVVRVVDYKTGKVKTKGEIEGTTMYSDGSAKRQLVFYKILCDLDKTFRYTAQKFELDYVGDGKIETKPKKHEFEITSKEVEGLKLIIVDSMNKIRRFKFEKTTEYNNCQFCDYKDHCWPDGIPTKQYQQGALEI